MNKKLKMIVSSTLICCSALCFAGCGDEDTVQPQENSNNEMTNDTENQTISTKEQYANYLDTQSKKYLSELAIDTDYDFDKVSEDTVELNEDYINAIKESYGDEVEKLTMLKNDLKNNVKSDDKEVNDLNNKVIESIDKNIKEIEGTRTTIGEKTKDLMGETKAYFISSMKEIQKLPKEAKSEYDKLVQDAKNTLGIQ